MDRLFTVETLLALPLLVYVITTSFGFDSSPLLPEFLAVRKQESHYYRKGEPIRIFANTIFPSQDQCGTRPYIDFPFCPPAGPIKRTTSLEEIISGDCWTNTRYRLKFNVNTSLRPICRKNFTKDEVVKLREAIKNDFEYDMFTENGIRFTVKLGTHVRNNSYRSKFHGLPLPRYYLGRQINFAVVSSGDNLFNVQASLGSFTGMDITDVDQVQVKFTYSVYWFEKDGTEDQQDSHSWDWAEYGLSWIFQRDLYIMVTISIVSAVYFITYFRRASSPYFSLLGACLGAGTHLLILTNTFFVRMMQIPERTCLYKSVGSYLLTVHVFASFVSGFTAVIFLRRHTKKHLTDCIIQAWLVLNMPMLVLLLFTRSVTKSVPMMTGMAVAIQEVGIESLLMLFLGSAVFQTLGASLAYYLTKEYHDFPSENENEGIVNEVGWRRWLVYVTVFSPIPSSVAQICLNRDAIIASLWGFKVCGALETLMSASIELVLLTTVCAFGLTWISGIETEAHRWWRLFLRCGGIAVDLFIAGLGFHIRTNRYNLAATALALGYHAVLCYAVFLVLGSLSYWTSSLAIRRLATHPHDN